MMATEKLTGAVLGAGNVGGTLGGKWIAAGHRVVFAESDPRSDATLVRARPRTKTWTASCVQTSEMTGADTENDVVNVHDVATCVRYNRSGS